MSGTKLNLIKINRLENRRSENMQNFATIPHFFHLFWVTLLTFGEVSF
jgi:hypothetical protein